MEKKVVNKNYFVVFNYLFWELSINLQKLGCTVYDVADKVLHCLAKLLQYISMF